MKLLSPSDFAVLDSLTPELLGAALPAELTILQQAMAAVERHVSRNRFHYGIFRDDGPLRRELYEKQMEFFAAGLEYPERCFMAANRVGKSEAGAFETTCHLTGDYPKWWPGRRFKKPVQAWACGKTAETTRDIVQRKLLGKVIAGTPKLMDGTGMVPGDLLGRPTWKAGAVTDLVDTVPVKHVSGGWSSLGLKSYAQGRGAFEGTEQHVVWLDEEPDMAVYGECLVRTATVDGIVLITFTPLEGMSEVVLQFVPSEMRPDL